MTTSTPSPGHASGPTPPLHPDLAPLAVLLGTWTGQGAGEYPTIEPFGYTESVTFGHGGKPFLVYAQRTWAIDDGRPLHVETGYWRLPSPDRLELVLVHPTGVTEISEGTLTRGDDGSLEIDVATAHVGLTATAKSVTALRRRFRVRPGPGPDALLEYELDMAAVGQPLVHHLAASLRKAPDR